MSLYNQIIEGKAQGKKHWVPLLDPDKCDEPYLKHLIEQLETLPVFWLVGGSLINEGSVFELVKRLKSIQDRPVCLFPGSAQHFTSNADAILYLSLISGRNPDYLIGQHVQSALTIKKSRLEVLPTGYVLIKCGVQQTTAEYLSGTPAIPYQKPEIAVATAIAGELLGMKMIYLDGGSGAEKPISTEMIKAVSSNLDIPLIVGGGIRTKADLENAWSAGADLCVVGTALEKGGLS
jgi:putative glycerol-1-phosphate prenyltransferase